MFLESQENFNNICYHKITYPGNNKFCKNCSCYLSQSLGKSITLINNRNKINPNKVYKNMISKHQINRYYNEDYYHEEHRKLIIFKVKTICKQLDYTEKTINISINYLDSIFSRYNFELNLFDLIILLCISIASKLNERIMNTLSFKTIYMNLQSKFSMDIIFYYEKLILKLLNWDINIIIPLDFFEFYSQLGVIYEKEMIEMYKISNFGLNFNDFIKFIQHKFYEFSKSILNLTNDYYIFYKFSSLTVAASCLAIGREYIGLTTWNNELCSFTFLNEENLNECYSLIKKIYKINTKQNQNRTPVKKVINSKYEILEKTADSVKKSILKEKVSDLIFD